MKQLVQQQTAVAKLKMTFLSSLAFLSVHTHIKGGGGLQTAKMHHVKKPKEKNTASHYFSLASAGPG